MVLVFSTRPMRRRRPIGLSHLPAVPKSTWACGSGDGNGRVCRTFHLSHAAIVHERNDLPFISGQQFWRHARLQLFLPWPPSSFIVYMWHSYMLLLNGSKRFARISLSFVSNCHLSFICQLFRPTEPHVRRECVADR